MKKATLTRLVSFRLTNKEYQIIKNYSDEKEIATNQVVRDLIQKFEKDLSKEQEININNMAI